MKKNVRNLLTGEIMKRLLFCVPFIFLSACGGSGGGGNSASSDFTSTPVDDLPEQLFVYEGESITVSSDNDLLNIEWQQLSGPEIVIDDNTLSDITITAPWITENSTVAEFLVTGELAGELQEQHIELTILDRLYYRLNIYSEETGATDLYIDYLSHDGLNQVPQEGMVQLTQLAANTEVCSIRRSPDGQLIAYGLDTGEGTSPTPTCRGVYMVDITSGITQKLSVLGSDVSDISIGSDIRITNLLWSPDGSQLYYQGDHGEGFSQHYAIDIDRNSNTASTGFLNYHNNNMATGFWPNNILYPIVDGGNSYGLETLVNTSTQSALWSGNSESASFYVYDNGLGESFLHQSSSTGDARRLDNAWLTWDILTLVDNEMINSSPSGECTTLNCSILLPPPIDYTFLPPSFSQFLNTVRVGSSVDGHLAFIADVLINDIQAIEVLSVRPPVINDGLTPARSSSSIVATLVEAAAWSPVSPHIAFTSTHDYRFHYSEEIGFNEPIDSEYPNIFNGVAAPEIPGQLYLYQNYQSNYTTPQERLAYPRPDIDDNFVRDFQWSESGEYIAYARGEENVEGAYLTSLWVTAVDDVRDESTATIDSNTQLLLNLRGTDNYFTDFIWSPTGNELLVLLQTNEGSELRVISRDGSTNIDLTTDNLQNLTDLFFLQLSFSPDGNYFAYQVNEFINGNFLSSLYIQSMSGGNPVRVNIPLSSGGSIGKYEWAPAGAILAYLARTATGEDLQLYLTNVEGNNQSWDIFLTSDQRIRDFSLIGHQNKIPPLL